MKPDMSKGMMIKGREDQWVKLKGTEGTGACFSIQVLWAQMEGNVAGKLGMQPGRLMNLGAYELNLKGCLRPFLICRSTTMSWWEKEIYIIMTIHMNHLWDLFVCITRIDSTECKG